MADGFASSHSKTTRAGEGMDRRAFSVADVEAMFEAGVLDRSERFELIGGEIVAVNSQLLAHAVVKSRLAGFFARNLPETLEGSVETTVELNDETLIEPDVIVTARLPIERRYLLAGEILLAIEVADTSLAFDLGTKAALYAAAGVPELWVVDLNGQETWVHREPHDGAYQSLQRLGFDQALPTQFEATVSVTVGTLLV